MPRRPGLNAAGQAGAGLVEVAIALLVLAIGGLGLGRLQIAGKRVGFEAIQRTQAATLAADMLERMRANRGALARYRVTGLGAASGSARALPGADCERAGCAPARRAAWDLWQWERALNGAAVTGSAGGLVRPLACVAIDGRRVRLEISWEGSGNTVAGSSTCGEPVTRGGGRGEAAGSRQSLRLDSWIGTQW